MTNSDHEEHNTNTGTTAPTSPIQGEFVSNKGTEFSIETKPNGLYYIKMKAGGVPPKICDELFTSRKLCVAILERYLREGDRAGYAVFPSKKVSDGKSQNN